ncbi:MAG: hypothetical protein AVDCRST_MAG85-317, partial [uncultured Solirubrobacteraceae bacterium]
GQLRRDPAAGDAAELRPRDDLADAGRAAGCSRAAGPDRVPAGARRDPRPLGRGPAPHRL